MPFVHRSDVLGCYGVLHAAECCFVFMLRESCRVLRLSKHVVNVIVKCFSFQTLRSLGKPSAVTSSLNKLS